MSWLECDEPDAKFADANLVEMVIVPRTSDLGGFEVRRALPFRKRRMIGPFIFLDQMGPSEFVIGEGLDVLPHPHIGLATVSYLLAGDVVHRDSLGFVQHVRAGDVAVMKAGLGIAHSERTAPEARLEGGLLYGLQAWLALPGSLEETGPSFRHHDKSELPLLEGEGIEARLVLGEAFGQRSPAIAPTCHGTSDLVYADISMVPGAVLTLDPLHEERGLYLVEGSLEIAGSSFNAPELLVLRPTCDVTVRAWTKARFAWLGGAPLDGPRHIWWNFVSSRQERIEQAKADWQAGRFGAVIGDQDAMPLPGT